MERTYLCIDLKSFYASVECVARGLDPMTTNLVVADPDRSEKTICLAVSPSMKALGVKNRCRVFEIPKSIDYIMAPPHMKRYIDCSAEVYGVYLSFIAKEDIHVYSVDEAFLDVTHYMPFYKQDAFELAKTIMNAIQAKTGVRATCGIGTNLYLTKVALDITAKHAEDFIGYLDEEKYRETLWDHVPLTDFWRIGRGIANRLAHLGISTMRGIANADEDALYHAFGIDAELIIDHAWGREPTTIADIKAYRSKATGISSGQVLMRDYNFSEGQLIVKEMCDALCLDLVDKNLLTKSITLHVGYSNALNMDSAHGTAKLPISTNSDKIIIPAAAELYARIVDPRTPVRRINISCGVAEEECQQMSLFEDTKELDRARNAQKAVLEIKKRFGKNAILKGMNLTDAATAQERNRQIGGHKSGEDD